MMPLPIVTVTIALSALLIAGGVTSIGIFVAVAAWVIQAIAFFVAGMISEVPRVVERTEISDGPAR